MILTLLASWQPSIATAQAPSGPDPATTVAPPIVNAERAAPPEQAVTPETEVAAPPDQRTSDPVKSKPEEKSHGLHSELSPWGMFLAADIVVKAVMVGLAAASFLVWTIWIAKWMQLWSGRRRLSRDLRLLAGRISIDAAGALLPDRKSLAFTMLETASRERAVTGGVLRPGSLDRISTRLAEIEGRLARDMRGGMSFLATVGATGPFVGLFGTVWGIMNSFVGIAKSQTTNLAVVAPGIAEALLATAIGLVAAIPAVILYNNLGKGVATVKRLARETRGEVERIASREMEGPVERHRYPSLASAAE